MDDYHFISSTKYGKIEKEEALNHTKKTPDAIAVCNLAFLSVQWFFFYRISPISTQNLKVRSSFALQRSTDLLWKCEIRDEFE
jgi:hypothetical protein